MSKQYQLNLTRDEALTIASVIEGDKVKRSDSEDQFLDDVHRRLFAFGADGKSLRRSRPTQK